MKQKNILKSLSLSTPLSEMIAIGDDHYIYLLQFTDYPKLQKQIARLQTTMQATIIVGTTPVLAQLQEELTLYFDGVLRNFKTPFKFVGTAFQKNTWLALSTVPYGTTQSYTELARALYKPSAFRAVANANGANLLCILVPCHRIINNNGKLGGYGGGIHRKQWLIEHEAKYYA